MLQNSKNLTMTYFGSIYLNKNNPHFYKGLEANLFVKVFECFDDPYNIGGSSGLCYYEYHPSNLRMFIYNGVDEIKLYEFEGDYEANAMIKEQQQYELTFGYKNTYRIETNHPNLPGYPNMFSVNSPSYRKKQIEEMFNSI